MFKLIRLTIVLGLMVGVVILGVRIHKKSSKMEFDLAKQKVEVAEKISELKKEAVKKTQALGRVYKEVNDSLDKCMGRKTSAQANKDSKKETVSPSPPSGTHELAVSLNPLDQEDRKLTAEILAQGSGNNQSSEDVLKISEMSKDSSISESKNAVTEPEPVEPPDLNRVTEIRDLYSKAIETLDLK
ncbi:MAG: hypothetical protein B1H11_02130 [Desulfobacteraceae bacterium 4484_190.1]|nr:MAG: hypothetical protein B1H11_02130 [Desulfobacteraceae bacterium 4484_190.1]